MAKLAKAKLKRGGRSGLGSVQKAAKVIDQKRAAGNRKWLKIEDGESVIVRVLDTGADFKDGWVHPVELTFTDDGGKEKTYTTDVMCLDQDEKGNPCPGCRDDLDRRYKFWTNVIARDWEDEDAGTEEDTLMIWSGGITVAKRLDKMNQRHDITSRDIMIEREGKKLNTKYDIDFAEDDDSALSSNDEKLAKEKHDLGRYVKIRDFDDFFKSNKELNDDNSDDGEGVGSSSIRRGSAFGGKKNTSKTRRVSTKGKTGLAAVKARAGDKKTEGGPKVKVKAKPKVKVKRS